MGLSKYYEFILKKLNEIKLTAPTENDIKTIEEDEVREKLEKLKKDLAEIEIDGETIH